MRKPEGQVNWGQLLKAKVRPSLWSEPQSTQSVWVGKRFQTRTRKVSLLPPLFSGQPTQLGAGKLPTALQLPAAPGFPCSLLQKRQLSISGTGKHSLTSKSVQINDVIWDTASRSLRGIAVGWAGAGLGKGRPGWGAPTRQHPGSRVGPVLLKGVLTHRGPRRGRTGPGAWASEAHGARPLPSRVLV